MKRRPPLRLKGRCHGGHLLRLMTIKTIDLGSLYM